MERTGRPIGSARPSVGPASTLVLLAACLVAFAAIAVVALQPGIPAIDTAMTGYLRDLASPSLDGLMAAVTGLGDSLVLAAVAGLGIVLLAVHRRTRALRFVALALAGSFALNHALKVLFGRPRPVLEWAEVRPDHAFPSGHAMNSFVVYVALALVVWQVWGRGAGIAAMALALGLSLAVGASRVYLGVHWLTDVLGGYLAGLLWLLVLAAAAARTPRPRDRAPDGGGTR